MNLRHHFIQGLMPRLDALNAARENFKNNPTESLKSIRRIAHILRGSGGTFGFPEVTALAAKVEEAEDKDLPAALTALMQLLTSLITDQDVVHIQEPVQVFSQDDLPVYYHLPDGMDEGNYVLKMVARDPQGRQATKTVCNIIVDTQFTSDMTAAFDTSSTVFNNGQAQRIEMNFASPVYPLDVSFKLFTSVKHRQLPILLVEDTPEDALLAKSVLNRANYEVIHTERADDALRIIDQKKISMVILDLILEDSDGRDFLIALRGNAVTQDIPAIILSSKNDIQTKTECLALGANAYFEKPLNPDLLLATISSQLNMSQKHQMESRFDLLTELPNRVAFKEQYLRTQAAMERSTISQFAVGMVDFDYFKHVNDQYGHIIGDKVLHYAANFIKRSLRKTDFIARWGGEEFVMLFPGTSARGAQQALDKIRKSLAENPYKSTDGTEIRITISGGITGIKQSIPMQAAIAQADNMLYKAKEAGRNKIMVEGDAFQRKEKQIVVVDDDDITAEFVQHRLEKEGYSVIRFDNGIDGYENLKNMTPTMIISDVKMPGMDGFELLKRLRELPSFHEIPIIMLTSIGKEKDIARGLNSGANDYIVKPFSATELIARVDRLLRKHETISD
ncbi:MAG: response regulator [Fidelibacterota bacterium]